METYPSLTVDVFKAGHHGYKGSSSEEFVSQLQPKLSLISADKNNRYGHPYQEVLDIFEESQTTVYRTDEQGAIRFRGWKNWQIETVK